MSTSQSKADDTMKFGGYRQHVMPQIQQFKTETFCEGDERQYVEDTNFSVDKIKLQQIDARLKNLEAQFARLCKDSDRAALSGLGDNDVYQVSNSSYQQAKINGIKMQFDKLRDEDD